MLFDFAVRCPLTGIVRAAGRRAPFPPPVAP